MNTSKSEAEWNANCDKVKAACQRALVLIREAGFISDLIEEEVDETVLTLHLAIAKAEGTEKGDAS